MNDHDEVWNGPDGHQPDPLDTGPTAGREPAAFIEAPPAAAPILDQLAQNIGWAVICIVAVVVLCCLIGGLTDL